MQHGVPGLPDIENVPYLDVTAVRSPDGQTLTLYCVNRSLDQDIKTRIDLGSFKASGTAKVEQITATDRYEENTEVEPMHVVPILSSLRVGTGSLEVTLPHESVTRIESHATR